MFSWGSLWFSPLLKGCVHRDVWSEGLRTSDGPARGWRESGRSGRTGETGRGEWWTCWRSRSAVTFFWTGIHPPLVSFSHLLLQSENPPMEGNKENSFTICFYSLWFLQDKIPKDRDSSRSSSRSVRPPFNGGSEGSWRGHGGVMQGSCRGRSFILKRESAPRSAPLLSV